MSKAWPMLLTFAYFSATFSIAYYTGFVYTLMPCLIICGIAALLALDSYRTK